MEDTILSYICQVLRYSEDNLVECLSHMKKFGYGYYTEIEDDGLIVKFSYDEGLYETRYKIARLDLSDYEVDGKTILVPSDFDPDDIDTENLEIEYLEDEGLLIIKDLKGNEIDRYNVLVEGHTNNTVKPTSKTTISKTTLTKFDDNAKTYDDIVKYFIIGGISILLVVCIVIYTKKKK